MQCATDREVVLQLDHHVLANQGLEKGVEQHHRADFSSASEQSSLSHPVFVIVCVCCLHISLSSDFELVVTPEYVMENLVNAGKQNP